MVNVAVMRTWLKRHFPIIDRNVDRFGYWAAAILLLWSTMTTVVSWLPSTANLAVAIFIGLGATCAISLTISVALVAIRYFRPLPQGNTARETPNNGGISVGLATTA
jgi:hypothetical protein